MLRGRGLDALALAVQEHFNPGQSVELLLGLPVDLLPQEVEMVRAELNRRGLSSKVTIGSGPWPVTLRVRFQRPARQHGVAILPLAVLVIAALGAVGIGAILGWRVGAAVEGIGASMARSLIPLTLVIGGIWIFKGYVEAKK